MTVRTELDKLAASLGGTPVATFEFPSGAVKYVYDFHGNWDKSRSFIDSVHDE